MKWPPPCWAWVFILWLCPSGAAAPLSSQPRRQCDGDPSRRPCPQGGSFLGLRRVAGAGLAQEAASQHTDEVNAPPTKYLYNFETNIGHLPITAECLFALLFVALVASVPFIPIVLVGGRWLTKTHVIESCGLILWLGGALLLYTNFLYFSSSHWPEPRPLSVVEAVYLLAQILTTVGYGDIVPAYNGGRLWVGTTVILALCLYGSIFMEVAGLVEEKLEHDLLEIVEELDEDDSPEGPAATARDSEKPLKEDWDPTDDPVDVSNLIKCAAAFSVLATTGVLFFHYFPGEHKTWLQAGYMSVITLSTVGFGDITPTTEGGKIFGAFWMIFGVATLGNLVGSFVSYMFSVKARERRNEAAEKLKFFRYINKYSHKVAGLNDKGMDEYEFMKFGLLLMNLATEKDILRIEERFANLGPGPDGQVDYENVRMMEGPPGLRRLSQSW